MPQPAQFLTYHGKVYRPGLTVRQRLLPWHTVLPFLRGLAALGLIVSLLGGVLNWLWYTPDVGALEFTAHLISTGVDTVGVQGMTTADLDGDSDIDIVTAGRDGLKVYENQGKLKFRIHIVDTIYGERPQVADLNKDGSRDILVTAKNSANIVRWYRNVGTLEYAAGVTILSSGKNAVAHAADINADGAIDIITARDESGAITLSRWMNNGSGTFTETVVGTDTKVSAVGAGDVDGNGYADIVTSGDNGLQKWTTSNGTTYTRADIDDSKPNRTHLVVTDPINGHLWIVTADASANVVAVYRGRSDYTYGRTQLELSCDAKTVEPVDLDGDGDMDVLVACQDDNAVMWYENDGQDHFTQRTLATNLQSVYGVAADDLDNDGDVDFVTGNLHQGKVIVYERIRAKPVATSATDVTQSTAGTGIVTFSTILSDGDRDATRVRVQYSLNGTTWEKPYITKVVASAGTVDLKNSNAYQVGTANGIDTNTNDTVTLTFTWDTKSVQNTGGAITGDPATVQLRFTPRDSKSVGDTVTSGKFRVDNKAPTELSNVAVTSLSSDQLTVTWNRAKDASAMTYKAYYDPDSKKVIDLTAPVWDSGDDVGLGDTEATSTIITGLKTNTAYYVKVVTTDAFGNTASAPSVRGTTAATTSSESSTGTSTTSPEPLPSGALTEPGFSPFPSSPSTTSPSSDAFFFVTPSPEASIPPGGTFTSPSDSPSSALTFGGTPTPTDGRELVNNPLSARVPSVLQDNKAPLADAGPDQVVNPQALVILDATASTDPDRDSLTFTWRQLAGSRVELQSNRTATPSFSAGETGGTYVFAVTIRDANGATATDTVTVAVKALPAGAQAPVAREGSPATALRQLSEDATVSPLVSRVLHPANLILFALALLSTSILLLERLLQGASQRRTGPRQAVTVPGGANQPQGKVVHYKTGEPIANAQVLIYGNDGKLRATERTNPQGVFGTFFPVGQYTLGVQAPGFSFAPTSARAITPPGGIVYTGGTLTIRDGNRALAIVIPMKPAAAEVTSFHARVLHLWQTVQHLGRVLSWPLFLAGALLNTTLVFLVPGVLYLTLEVLYIVLVIVKIALEVRVRPAYGQVRDAITHVPLDLAVVRLFDQKTNRLVMTRVTNNQGKFFALPPAGLYTVTISKPGYVTFSKQGVEIEAEHDSTLQMTADLMPVVPNAGRLQQPRPAVA